MMLKVIILCCALQSIAGAKIQNPNIDRIFGGNTLVEAAEGQAPYHCSLGRKNYHSCSCAILSAKYVVTMGGCLTYEELDTLQIVVGSNKLYPEGKVYKPEKFIIHESYDKPEGAYNIGLIRLQTPIEFNEKVQPIKFSKKSVEAGSKLTVTGWLMVKGEEQNTNQLQLLNVTSISNEKCTQNPYPHPQDSQMCTMGLPVEGICDGDYGGPLVYKNGQENELVGLINSGYPCDTNKPTVYTKIAYVYDWIMENMS